MATTAHPLQCLLNLTHKMASGESAVWRGLRDKDLSEDLVTTTWAFHGRHDALASFQALVCHVPPVQATHQIDPAWIVAFGPEWMVCSLFTIRSGQTMW